MSQSQFVDYKLNSSFLPHCLLPENDTSRVFACLFFVLFYYYFSLCLIENFCSEWKMCVCAFKGFDFWCWLQGGPVCEENWYEWTWSFFSSFVSSPLHCLIDHLSCLSPWARPCGFGDMWIQIHHFYSYPHGSDSVRGGSPSSNLYV